MHIITVLCHSLPFLMCLTKSINTDTGNAIYLLIMRICFYLQGQKTENHSKFNSIIAYQRDVVTGPLVSNGNSLQP